MEMDESANDTLTTTNSSNITEPSTIFKPLQRGLDLSELITNSFIAAFTSNLKSSLNMTQESLEKIQLQVTSNITSALKSILLLSESEGTLDPPDEAAIYTLWYTDNPPNASDYFTDTYNKTATDTNSTAKTIIDDVALSNGDYWYVKYNIIRNLKAINEIVKILILYMYNFLIFTIKFNVKRIYRYLVYFLSKICYTCISDVME